VALVSGFESELDGGGVSNINARAQKQPIQKFGVKFAEYRENSNWPELFDVQRFPYFGNQGNENILPRIIVFFRFVVQDS
jgi:O-glycosyl hydrolase